MNRLYSLSTFVAVVLSLAGHAARGADETRPGWLDVKECGASGSALEVQAATVEGSPEIKLAKPGDFRPGQEVMISKCHPHYERCVLKPPENPYATAPLGDAAEMRGYDGSSGGWTVFIVEIDAAEPLSFRWSDDMARTWKGKKVPVTFDWQPLSEGTEIKFKRQEWQPGHMITFSARDQLLTKIEKVEGNVLTLAQPATRTVKDAVVRHCDTAVLQATIQRAVREQRNVYFPPGHYRLSTSLAVNVKTSIVIEGASAADTVLDISEGYGACMRLYNGTEATVRNFRMVGHTGLGEGPGWRSFPTSSGKACWPVGTKACQAVTIRNTERVLIENVHASRMNCEAFYCQGDSRAGAREPKAYTKSLTYLRCSATNCDGNAFNNNDMAENTSVLHCRIVDVGGCTWEGASRFVRFMNNYVRNSGTVAMGNIGSRIEHFEQLPSGQHIVADNVFESRTFYANRPGGYIIRAAHGAHQVIVRNNLFVNYASCGVEITGMADNRHLPASMATVTGNIFDMTQVDGDPIKRTAINVSASGVTVSDNQIYVRGACDPNVTALLVKEPAVDVIAHNNLIRNCGQGIATGRVQGIVAEVKGPDAFLIVSGRGVPLERRRSHRYADWNVVWLKGTQPAGTSVIAAFDPETLVFTLREPREVKPGDRFEIYPPAANWDIHDNMVVGCQQPVLLDSYGSKTSLLRGNLIARGDVTGVEKPLDVRGQFELIDNRVVGFDEATAPAAPPAPAEAKPAK